MEIPAPCQLSHHWIFVERLFTAYKTDVDGYPVESISFERAWSLLTPFQPQATCVSLFSQPAYVYRLIMNFTIWLLNLCIFEIPHVEQSVTHFLFQGWNSFPLFTLRYLAS